MKTTNRVKIEVQGENAISSIFLGISGILSRSSGLLKTKYDSASF